MCISSFRGLSRSDAIPIVTLAGVHAVGTSTLETRITGGLSIAPLAQTTERDFPRTVAQDFTDGLKEKGDPNPWIRIVAEPVQPSRLLEEKARLVKRR